MKLKVRRQKRLGLRRSVGDGGDGGDGGGGKQQRYDRTESVLARARAFVGEDDDGDYDEEGGGGGDGNRFASDTEEVQTVSRACVRTILCTHVRTQSFTGCK